MDDRHETLAQLLGQDKFVAIVDQSALWRGSLSKKLQESFQVRSVSFEQIAEIENEVAPEAYIGAIILGLPEITGLADVEPVCQLAAKIHVPLVIMTTTSIPPEVDRYVLREYNVDTNRITVDIASGKSARMACELLAEGLLAMTNGVDHSDSYRRTRIQGF